MSDGIASERVEQVAAELEKYRGAPYVNVSEIQSAFSGASKALDFAKQFRADLFKNIAYIFNKRGQGYFGIYDPNLNHSIHIATIAKKLRDMGYQTWIEEDPGMKPKLYAAMQGKDEGEVTQIMQKLLEQEEQLGGITFDLDVGAILSTADEIAVDAVKTASPDFQQKFMEDPSFREDVFNKFRISELGSVMVHEAEHAAGATEEGKPKGTQSEFKNWALKQQGLPFEVDTTRPAKHAAKNSWYRRAQLLPFQHVLIDPVLRSNQNFSEQFFPTRGEPNDSVETLLQKNWHVGEEEKTKSIEGQFEEEREEEVDGTTEELLEEQRAHPLVILIPKAADRVTGLTKKAGVNSNIGGQGIGSWLNIPRFWGWPFDGRDITDKPSEKDMNDGIGPYWIKLRYNPLFQSTSLGKDRLGNATFNWHARADYASTIFKNRPYLFKAWPSSMYWGGQANYGVAATISPANADKKKVVIYALRRIGFYKSAIRNKKKKAVRLLFEESVLMDVSPALQDIKHFVFQNDNGKHKIVWLVANDVKLEELKDVESDIVAHRNFGHTSKFVGLSEDLRVTLNFIFEKCRILGREYGIQDTYVIGGFTRTMASTKNYLEINDLDFSSASGENCLKLGGLLAADLGVDDVEYLHRTGTITFEYKGVKMDFRGKFIPPVAKSFMRQNGISVTPLNYDIYSRDFTINSLVYDYRKNKIFDVSGRGLPDLKVKIVRTFFDPDLAIPLNPLLVTRAIALNLKGYRLDPELNQAMHKHAQELFSSGYTGERLAYECQKIIGYGKAGEYMLQEYGLERLKEIREKVLKENPEIFEE